MMTKSKNRYRAVCVLLAAGVLAACGGAPKAQYYTLSSAPSGSGSSGSTSAAVGVAAPRASHMLRQDRVVYFTAENELNYYANHRWADTPPRLVQTQIMKQLNTSGLFGNVVAYRAQKGLDYVLRGRLLAMEEVDTATDIKARFGLELELVREEDGLVVWTGRHGCERPVGVKSVGAVVDTLNGCVQETLGELTRSLGAVLPDVEAARKAEAKTKP
ncbi:MAG TPA: ABC-type transport auxiliary lipoprotein family protein [Candidatus Xenobia bacterium]|nr:ABC-type transport auxiliary lipoprotein family protein [Candidatus Xenobia bacterium]